MASAAEPWPAAARAWTTERCRGAVSLSEVVGKWNLGLLLDLEFFRAGDLQGVRGGDGQSGWNWNRVGYGDGLGDRDRRACG
jgi:hypothetical protein